MLATTLLAGAAVAVTAAPAAAQDATVKVTGHGFGHGRGMGQWGAQGYARDRGWSYRQILGHFYGGTNVAHVDGARNVSVWLKALDNKPLKVFAADAFQVNGITVDGTAQISAENGQWVLRVAPRVPGTNCRSDYGAPRALGGTGTTVRVSSPIDPVNDVWRMLGVCGTDGSIRHYRGALDITTPPNTTSKVTNIAAVDAYIRGVVPRESPASWHPEALKAQAVAARSYAITEGGENGSRFGWAKTCDDTQCQVYGGAGYNGVTLEHPNTDAAINQTFGEVRRFGNGNLARTEFSSSTGGHTSGTPQCSACSFPTVEDLGDSISPYHDWSVDLSASAIASAYGIGTYTGIEITQRNGVGAEGGRVLQMRVNGTTKSVTITGDDFRQKFGLRSNWFSVGGSTGGGGGGGGGGTPPPANGLSWQIRNSTTGGGAEATYVYGLPGDTVLAGDWDGNGRAGMVTVKNAVWYFRDSQSSGSPEYWFQYGKPGDIPVVGDWNGDGKDGIGNFKDGTFYLKDTAAPGPPDYVLTVGKPGDIPVVGDWNGDGTDSTGQVLRGTWYLKNAPKTGGDADIPAFNFGATGDKYIVGDWDGNGTDTPIIVRG